jgi:D-glycero-D-manno-heptose 1,7-bisphosphate phosphatase
MSRAFLLDRDGIINVEKNYVHRVEDFEFIDGIFELCARAMRHRLRLIVITNQAGIARGYYTVADYERLTEWMLDTFSGEGIRIDRVYYCPYHPTAGIGEYRRESFDRKPNPGMILRARDDFALDLPRSVLLGDKDSDLQAGRAAGVGYCLKLLQSSGQAESGPLEFTSLHAVGDWLERTFD